MSQLVRRISRCYSSFTHSVRFHATTSAAVAESSITQDLHLTSLPIETTDPELYKLLNQEATRQKESLNLSPLENYASRATLDTIQTVLQNKYSEGYPRARYYGGNENVDDAEELCQSRALELFNLNKDEWDVNVQPLSNAISNLESLTAILTLNNENNAHNLRVLTLNSSNGGDITLGSNSKSSLVSKLFNIMFYETNENSQLIDYNKLSDMCNYINPNVVIAGSGVNSGYPRQWVWQELNNICKKNSNNNSNNTLLMCDISDVAGLIATGLYPSPFDCADIVTCAPSTSLRGPKGAAIIFSRKEYGSSVDMAVFPGHQGGPHNHAISAMAASLGQAKSEDFKHYQSRCLENASVLANELDNEGLKLLTGGTDTTTVIVDNNASKISNIDNFDENNINIFYDNESNTIRMSSLAMTTRGLNSSDFKTVAKFVKQAAKGETENLGNQVTEFVQSLPLPGVDIVN